MGGGLAFLSKKRFNPSNFSNQRQVWEAKQKASLEEQKQKEREEQLKREREDEELARSLGGKVGGDAHQLKFMYDAPPGLAKQAAKSEDNNHNEFTDFDPGDDEAAAEFRRMIMQGNQIHNQTSTNDTGETGDSASAATAAITSKESTKLDTRTQLEKEAGRAIQSGAVTLQEQLERFPQLKGAPMAQGMSTQNVHVAFKPMGQQLRNVRCLKCGIWGHSVGDRECKLTGWNPFEAAAAPATTSAISILPDACHVEEHEQYENRVLQKLERRLSHASRSDNSYSSVSDDSYERGSRRHKKSSSSSKRRKHRHERKDEDRKRRKRRRESSRNSSASRKRRDSREKH